MIRALILDDMPEQGGVAKEVLERVFVGAQVDVAKTVEAAQRLLKDDVTAYDAIIADVKVPVNSTCVATVSHEWIDLLDGLDSRKTVVIINSAYLAEDEVRNATSDVGTATTPIAKGGGSTKKIVARIAGAVIRKRLDQWLGTGSYAEEEDENGPIAVGGSLILSRLMFAIRILWTQLSKVDQQRVRKYFDVEEEGARPPSVTLGGTIGELEHDT